MVSLLAVEVDALCARLSALVLVSVGEPPPPAVTNELAVTI
jgi:hypothetical protein